MRSRLLLWGITAIMSAILGLFVIGCGSSDVFNQNIDLRAVLSGGQVVPPVTTTATGTAQVVINKARDAFTVTLQTQGLTNVTSVEIRVGRPGENGPPIFTLFTSAEGAFPAILTRELTSANLIPQPAQGITNFGQAIQTIREGHTYILVSTPTNVNGVLRGQIGPVTMVSDLSGANVVPPVTTTASGNATVTLNNTQDELHVQLTTSGLSSVVGAQIRVGAPGTNGPVIFNLYTTADGAFPGTLDRQLTAQSLIPEPGIGINTFDDAVRAILDGDTYIVVLTSANGQGEIRGQIVTSLLGG